MKNGIRNAVAIVAGAAVVALGVPRAARAWRTMQAERRQALVDMALSQEPEGAQPAEIAGPREEYLPDLAQLVAAKRGEQVKIEAVSNPADPDDALNSNGGLLPSPHATLAGPTFAEWLEKN